MRARCISGTRAPCTVLRRATPVARERAPTGVICGSRGSAPLPGSSRIARERDPTGVFAGGAGARPWSSCGSACRRRKVGEAARSSEPSKPRRFAYVIACLRAQVNAYGAHPYHVYEPSSAASSAVSAGLGREIPSRKLMATGSTNKVSGVTETRPPTMTTAKGRAVSAPTA
jgi:hypothetical protein